MEIKKNVAFIANSCSRLPIKAYLFIHSPVATRKQPGEEKKRPETRVLRPSIRFRWESNEPSGGCNDWVAT